MADVVIGTSPGLKGAGGCARRAATIAGMLSVVKGCGDCGLVVERRLLLGAETISPSYCDDCCRKFLCLFVLVCLLIFHTLLQVRGCPGPVKDFFFYFSNTLCSVN